jgi:hypothetical protein
MNNPAEATRKLVCYLRDISPKYERDLNSMPIFEVMALLETTDQKKVKDIVFSEWNNQYE